MHQQVTVRNLNQYILVNLRIFFLIYKQSSWKMNTSLQTILNKSWRQHPNKQQLYGHQPAIMKTIQVRRTRHVGHCWRSKDELISNILQWTSLHGQAKAGWPARTYIQQLCVHTGCNLEDLPRVMDDRDRLWERVREIHTGSTSWWWYIKKEKKRNAMQILLCVTKELSNEGSIWTVMRFGGVEISVSSPKSFCKMCLLV